MSASSAATLPTEPGEGAGRAVERRLAVGAEVVRGGVHFRVWAPERSRIEVVVDGDPEPHPLAPDGEGYWAGLGAGLRPGARYRFRVDGDDRLLPDPASRFQPDGPHGASQVVDPRAFTWTDAHWRGVSLPGQVLYELHLGTFTDQGTWRSAMARLPYLRDLGVTIVEVMPVAEFPGAFGWGYDGVDLFAPSHLYGRPDDFRRFVDEAHALGLAVILDVVYNHFGPDGNYLERFSSHYFSARQTDWGRAINYDGPEAQGARTLVIENAAYWIAEFHLDGLRLDATQSIYDQSSDHVLAALVRRARAAAGGRGIVVVAENETQEPRLVRPPEAGGCGLDALFNEDLQHSAFVAATGHAEGYYAEYTGAPQELISAARHGYLYQGQWYGWQKKARGHSTEGVPRWRLAGFLENHDQVGNSARGARFWQLTSPGRHRALTTYLLLGPWTPLLFQGEEWNASTPFLYFADHEAGLRELVREGRARFLAQFPSCASPEAAAALADPGDPRTLQASRLRWGEQALPAHQAALCLHRDLLALRRRDGTIAAQGEGAVDIEGAVLGPECFLLRYSAARAEDDRLLLVNLGRELLLAPAPEPLLGPPERTAWRLLFCSEERRYGGEGAVAPVPEGRAWRIGGQSASLLAPAPRADERR
jgi:maltooligosyltrehalose trehalohydrolase